METCVVTCDDTGKNITCDVIQRSDKQLKVAIPKTTITVILKRTDVRKPYIGHGAGMIFNSRG